MNRLKDILLNISIGLWNNYGIIGKIIYILFSPLALAIVLTFWVFKFGLKLFSFLIDEVNYHWRKWAEGSAQLNSLLGELIKKKINVVLIYLWRRLFGENYIIDRERNKLQANWWLKILLGFASQLYLISGLLIILVTFSSLIYSIDAKINFQEINIVVLFSLRLLLLTPIGLRYVRHKLSGKPFSWTPEQFQESAIKTSLWKYLSIFIVTALLLILGYLYEENEITPVQEWNFQQFTFPALNSSSKSNSITAIDYLFGGGFWVFIARLILYAVVGGIIIIFFVWVFDKFDKTVKGKNSDQLKEDFEWIRKSKGKPKSVFNFSKEWTDYELETVLLFSNLDLEELKFVKKLFNFYENISGFNFHNDDTIIFRRIEAKDDRKSLKSIITLSSLYSTKQLLKIYIEEPQV